MANRNAPGLPSRLGPGTVLDGKYEILSALGAGGMGEVFKARHLHLDAFRCIKVMKQGLLTDPAFLARFLREARLATQIHHPNVAVVHDFFVGDGGSYMVTEFIDGTTVRQWAAENGPFPLALAADVASQVLAGLDHIHKRGLLHRDVSADNIMLSFDSDDRLEAKIIDLGVAKDVNAVTTDTTQSGMLIGNPRYMSPEQLGYLPENEQLDGRADLYSLGLVLYEMLLDVSPFASETPHGYIMKHLTKPPPPFGDSRPGSNWPVSLESVVLKALEKDRRQRYKDAREFVIALRPFLDGAPGSMTRDGIERANRLVLSTIAIEKPARIDVATEVEGTLAKARLFERELIDQVTASEKDGDREALQRLAEGHPRGGAVGDAARAALARLRTSNESDEEAFQRAWEKGTAAAWQSFVDRHPGSPLLGRAQTLLAEAKAYAVAAGRESETALREFLKVWPEGRHRLEAEIVLVAMKPRLTAAAFHRAIAADTYAAVRDFLAKYPASAHEREATAAAAERLAFETAMAIDSEEAWDEYLSSWSGNPHEAEARVLHVRARVREEAAYVDAMERKSAASWVAFLSKQPEGKRKRLAEAHRREALAFEVAAGRRDALESFIRAWPNGLLIKEARRLVRQLSEQEDFSQARAVGGAAAWQFYLAAHPGGAHADEARQRLSVLEDSEYAAMLNSRNKEAARSFLATYPESPRREAVNALLKKWREAAAVAAAHDALAAGDVTTASAMLVKISAADSRQEIESAISAAKERSEWEIASRSGSAKLLEAFLATYPRGSWAADVRRQLSRLADAKRDSEPEDFDRAWEAGTAAAWEEYLVRHHNSGRREEAEGHRQEAADFEMATQMNSLNMWRAFLKSWPEGRHAIDAGIRLRSFR